MSHDKSLSTKYPPKTSEEMDFKRKSWSLAKDPSGVFSRMWLASCVQYHPGVYDRLGCLLGIRICCCFQPPKCLTQNCYFKRYQSQPSSTTCPQARTRLVSKQAYLGLKVCFPTRWQDGIKDTHQQPNETTTMSANDDLHFFSQGS